MLFEGTKAPDPDMLESDAAKFVSSAETFKELSLAIKPELIKAHEIITKCAGGETGETAVTETKPEPENVPATAETKTPEPVTKEPSKISKVSVILIVIGVILCIIGTIELVLTLKG